jgi:cytochrome P450
MNECLETDWNPTSDEVLRDQRATYDALRERCPVAYSDFLGFSVFRHQDVVRVLKDPATFSSVVSTHLSVPNGMDAPEHTGYRRLIERYFEPQAIAAFEPACRQIAAGLARSLRGRGEVELIAEFAELFAVRVQCAFLGWPAHMHEPLRCWTQKNREASLAQDRPALAALSSDFAGYVDKLLQSRRAGSAQAPPGDIVASLLGQQINGRPLQDDEIVSILRNWTVGEVGTMAAAVGILAEHLCRHAGLQQRLRTEPALLPEAIEEILRLHGPLVNNRRTATCPVQIGGRQIEAGQRISLNWIAANRDARAFDDASAFRLERDQSANLLWGAGIHICPGAPLARMELRLALEELLGCTNGFSLVAERPPAWAVYPASGFASLPLALR